MRGFSRASTSGRGTKRLKGGHQVSFVAHCFDLCESTPPGGRFWFVGQRLALEEGGICGYFGGMTHDSSSKEAMTLQVSFLCPLLPLFRVQLRRLDQEETMIPRCLKTMKTAVQVFTDS